MSPPRHTDVITALTEVADPQRAANSAWFFKTGPGEYAEGDQFIGVKVPDERKVARQYKELPIAEAIKLLQSPIHDHRQTALFILVGHAKKADLDTKRQILKLYLANTAHVNNWDLVDCSAEYIVGPLVNPDNPALLHRLAKSKSLWERRIAMIATYHCIKQGIPGPTLEIAQLLLDDSHDLIHKAVGWMLREVGARCDRQIEVAWLTANNRYQTMPRTALRYAIEHFEPTQRQALLKGTA